MSRPKRTNPITAPMNNIDVPSAPGDDVSVPDEETELLEDDVKKLGALDADSVQQNRNLHVAVKRKKELDSRVPWNASDPIKYNMAAKMFSANASVYIEMIRPSEAHIDVIPLSSVPDYSQFVRLLKDRYWRGTEVTYKWAIVQYGNMHRAVGRVTFTEDPLIKAKWESMIPGNNAQQHVDYGMMNSQNSMQGMNMNNPANSMMGMPNQNPMMGMPNMMQGNPMNQNPNQFQSPQPQPQPQPVVVHNAPNEDHRIAWLWDSMRDMNNKMSELISNVDKISSKTQQMSSPKIVVQPPVAPMQQSRLVREDDDENDDDDNNYEPNDDTPDLSDIDEVDGYPSLLSSVAPKKKAPMRHNNQNPYPMPYPYAPYPYAPYPPPPPRLQI